jgi:hypothetical protein
LPGCGALTIDFLLAKTGKAVYNYPMHTRDHSHSHEHGHPHGHDHEHLTDPEKTEALLAYMLDHNRSHGAEIGELAHSLYHAGKEDAAKLLDEGFKDFEKGTEKLAKALELLRPAGEGGK